MNTTYPTALTICDSCGSSHQWTWADAFDECGFGDGYGLVMTSSIADILIAAGYVVETIRCGKHNVIISSIKRDGVEQIPANATIGYDDPRGYLPAEIVTLLDCKVTGQVNPVSLHHGRKFIKTSTTTADVIAKIRKANDAYRRGFQPNGQRFITKGILGLSSEDRAAILEKVRKFDAFTDETDPHDEHDFGCIKHAGQRIFWKIDCYDAGSLVGMREPIDSTKVTRVLTTMLADEYRDE